MHIKQLQAIWPIIFLLATWLASCTPDLKAATTPDITEDSAMVEIILPTLSPVREAVTIEPSVLPTDTLEAAPTLRPSPTPGPPVESAASVQASPQPADNAVDAGTTVPLTATSTSLASAPSQLTGNNHRPISTTIGSSYFGRPIIDYQLGQGEKKIALIGGMHGGYEWNTILLLYEMLDYFVAQPQEIPPSVSLHIVPSANPDGQFAVTGFEGRFEDSDVFSDTVPGRFNGRGVDLNRNWDCLWMPTGTWRGNVVSAGTQPFSEPETGALRTYFLALQPDMVVFFHSAANGVFPARCPDVHQPSLNLAKIYGLAGDYPIHEVFQHYEINGDASDWLSTQSIPSFTVELITHEDLDWQKNLAGMKALLALYEGAEQ